MRRVAHIINPVTVEETSDLHAAQPVTFETMRVAKAHAHGRVNLELYSSQFPEDRYLVPEWITPTNNLDRSILDVEKFNVQRKLPLIKDVLDRLYVTSDADYFIYTNVDIALMPHFYTAVDQLIASGCDAMVINRRTIAKTPSDQTQIPLMWAQTGKKHPGYDCFVFRRAAYPLYDLGSACLGANWIGRVLFVNVCAYADNFQLFGNFHLTFHLGDDRSWNIPEYLDYDQHNMKELLKVLNHFSERGYLAGNYAIEEIHNEMLRNRRVLNYSLITSRIRRWWRS